MKDNGRLGEIIDAVLKPLKYASKDNFHHLGTLKSLEPLVNALCLEAATLGAPPKLSEQFVELKDLFIGFDSLDLQHKTEKISAAFEIISSIENSFDKTLPTITAEEAQQRLAAICSPVQALKGVGPNLAERLAKKGLSTVEDLLYFLPIRYEDRSRMKKIRELTPGMSEITSGEVLASGEVYYGRRRVFEMAVGDGSSILKVKWFHFRPSMKSRYKNGQKVIVFGQVSLFGGQKEMIHPDVELMDEDAETENAPVGIVPVYSQVENFHQKTIRNIVLGAVEKYGSLAIGGVPASVLSKNKLMGLPEAIKEVHQPGQRVDRAKAARRSLVFDELFMLELGLALKKAQTKKESGIAFKSKGELESRLRGLLPFTLTKAQERVVSEIKADMSSTHPMNRLVQGDVGSGKTVVSLIAALHAIEAGYQAALMAPTEILAEQHYLLTHEYAASLGIKAALLTGSVSRSEKKAMYNAVASGEVQLVIGTHALIQKDVEFKKLGLAVVDEQHRFGVLQRGILKKKGFGAENGISPDMVIMTATPIPRTLSMTVFGDLDVSVIDELPPGRTPVKTTIVRESGRQAAYDAIKKELEGGSQAYIVYPLVDESTEIDLKDATSMKEHLERDIFMEWKLGLLHGRMKAEEKEAVMKAFKDKKIHILVSTTVIEVGVDVPNATVMLIEHAERFGLAQLHQLRGRVGRGEKRSICLLLASWTNSEDTYRRLKIMEETNDGFRIAEEDLKIRGAGDFLGTRQAGLPDFRTEEALADTALLKAARDEAFAYLGRNPILAGIEGEVMKMVLKTRWAGKLDLAGIG
jgi:ATP-dependent DNA helicase RecG